MPTLSSSPRMRSAPQRGLLRAMSRMSAAGAVGGRPDGLERRLHLRLDPAGDLDTGRGDRLCDGERSARNRARVDGPEHADRAVALAVKIVLACLLHGWSLRSLLGSSSCAARTGRPLP